jgi:hypothetical protein
MRLRIEVVRDPESENWSFRVPSLGIIGGANSREAAEREALDAVAFTLEAEEEAMEPQSGEVHYLDLELSDARETKESA